MLKGQDATSCPASIFSISLMTAESGLSTKGRADAMIVAAYWTMRGFFAVYGSQQLWLLLERQLL
jgi:hypothetical protein